MINSITSMSFSVPSISSGGVAAKKAYKFGRTYVVMPKGKHQATLVWLHGLGDHGGSWSQILETLPLPNIKWICPTAPSRPVSLFGGFPSTAWFDEQNLSEDAQEDMDGLDAAAAHVVNLLSAEPTDIKVGVGGFSMGAATALHTATCHVSGKYASGEQFPVNLSAAVGLSGWLPSAKTLTRRVTSNEAANRAASLPILVCHGKVDDIVPYKFGEKSSEALISSGFGDVTFKSYDGLGHSTNPEEVHDICNWLKSRLNLS
ncbi:hypothetical protein RND81_07G105100 [Saponaria officinalis]|uniref:Phospholipase/carboxylesterase/thioesterase domain-containing protein n=1 Tax=Saponaria officinalis TaxID=3572 RepID=A0AAW1JPF7_SAPOF